MTEVRKGLRFKVNQLRTPHRGSVDSERQSLAATTPSLKVGTSGMWPVGTEGAVDLTLAFSRV